MDVASDHSSKKYDSMKMLFFISVAIVAISISVVIVMNDSDYSDASTSFTVDGIKYETTSASEVKVVSNSYSYSGSVTIPLTVTYSDKEYSVISIGDCAFALCISLTSVTIGNSVTSIGELAFSTCRSLTSVTIPNSVTSIGKQAFYECKSLTSVTIGNSVISIDNWAFYECTSLTSVIIGNSVASIGELAFYKCTPLTSVTIPNSVTSIGKQAFYECTSLTEINVSENNEKYCSVSGVLFNKEKTQLIIYPACRPDTSYTIPDSVTSIGEFAFSWCTSLTSVTIPNSVTSIGGSAFFRCTSLTSVAIGNSVISIDNWAFYECTSLTSVTIPNSVTSIGDYAFSRCTSLTSVTIGNSVTSIGKWAFHECTSLTEINVSENNEKYCSVSGVLFNKEKTQLIIYPACRPDTSYTIPDSVTSIGGYAFYECTSLTSVTIPDSVTSIGGYAFYECTSLTSVTIGNIVTSIGGHAFALGTSTHNIVCYVYGCKEGKLDPYGGAYTSFIYNKLFIVTFMSQDGGNKLDTDAVQFGSNASYPGDDPTKDPTAQYTYTFAGWNSNTGKESATTDVLKNITSDKTVYAAFSKTVTKYTAIFYSNGGSLIEPQVVEYKASLSEPEQPVREGYSFTGWFYNDEKYDFKNSVTCDMILVAHWAVIEYTITYNVNGGSSIDPIKYTVESDKIILSTESVKDGCSFDGWCDNADLTGEPIKEIPAGSVGDRTYYAKWSSSSSSDSNMPLIIGAIIAIIGIVSVCVFFIQRK